MITNVSLEAMLAAITGTGGEFNGCKLGLNTNAIEPVPTNVLADFVEANYTGYAHSAAVVFGAPALNAAGQIESLGTLTTFQPTDAGAAPWSRDVPLVIGSNKFEFLVTTSTPALRTANEADAAAWAHQRYGDRADAYIAAVRKAWPDDRRPSTIVDLDTRMRPGVIRQASLKARAGGAPVYTYVFAWEAPVDDGLFKTMHCMEIPFVFNSIDRALMQTGGSKDAYALATAMSGAWVQFARTGKPGHARLPQWPAYTPETGSTMIFNTTSQVRQNHDADLIKAVEGS